MMLINEKENNEPLTVQSKDKAIDRELENIQSSDSSSNNELSVSSRDNKSNKKDEITKNKE